MLTEEEIKTRIARRAARELSDGMIVNLGVGIPTLVANHVGAKKVFLQSENGLIGVGPYPGKDEEEPNLINAGRRRVTLMKGGAFFDSAEAFAQIRGGHIDCTIIGALQVSARGDLANWLAPGKAVLGVGGAMDLVTGVPKVVVATQHRTKKGEAKLLPACTLPLTARGVVDMVITEYAVFRIEEQRLTLAEITDDTTVGAVAAMTGARFEIAEDFKVREAQ